MLVLARRPDESIIVDFSSMSDADLLALRAGAPIHVTVVQVRGDKVRLGFTAPGCVKIDREEIVEKRRQSPPLGEVA
jgi:sRNA-binding carbon storage regulator CsrA